MVPTSKINGTPINVYLPISKLHSILAVAILLTHSNISQICYQRWAKSSYVDDFEIKIKSSK